jgi:hypothetical protein
MADKMVDLMENLKVVLTVKLKVDQKVESLVVLMADPMVVRSAAAMEILTVEKKVAQ